MYLCICKGYDRDAFPGLNEHQFVGVVMRFCVIPAESRWPTPPTHWGSA